ncbi:MAG: hypothetical protein MRJ68_17925 [Nitrospira sp.]|nr:hypothetical protein [Nitrospira sp.]
MSCLNLSRPLKRTLCGSLLLNLILVLGGCVGVDDFKAVQREAEALGVELRMEQQRAQELDGHVHQLNEKIRELERTAETAREEAVRPGPELKCAPGGALSPQVPTSDESNRHLKHAMQDF